jgi:glutaredoxin
VKKEHKMVTVYSKNNCPYCVQAKNLLTLKGINYTEIKIDEDTAAKEFVVGEGHRTVPQIYQDGKLLVEGGYQGLARQSEEFFQTLKG